MLMEVVVALVVVVVAARSPSMLSRHFSFVVVVVVVDFVPLSFVVDLVVIVCFVGAASASLANTS